MTSTGIYLLCVFGIFSVGYGNILKGTLLNADALAKVKAPPTPADNNKTCSMAQTMAWSVCGKKVNCPITCTTKADCTFPYCNMNKQCECAQTFCHNDQMCFFFRIKCSEKKRIKCVEGSCLCGIP